MNSKILFKHICREDTYMFNYTQLPDELFTIELFATLSLHAKVLYSFMLRRVSISKDNNWIDDTGDVFIYYRVDEIMEKFNCSNKTAAKIISELEEIGLIEKRRQGQGKPDIIYVNKFSSIEEDQEEEPELPIDHMELLADESSDALENIPEGIGVQSSEVKKIHFKKCKKFTSKNEENTPLGVKKVHANYKENNNIEKVSSSSLSPPDINRENIRLIEEEKEKIKYQEAERLYSAHIAVAVFEELMKRDQRYRDQFTAEMYLKICKAVAVSKEPIISMPGFINWCMDRISYKPRAETNQFCQFPQRSYDFEKLEYELLRR